MLRINQRIQIPLSEFEWTFVRASGPGGQNVNKVASKAVLRWNVVQSPSLPPDVKERLLARNRRVTEGGDLLIRSQRYRDQGKNVQDCLDKLQELVRQATVVPKRRKATRPTRSSKERRLQSKRQRSQRKAGRGRPAED